MQITETEPPDDIMAEPLHLVIRNLLSFADIKRTPENLAKLLSLKEDRVLTLLKKLESAEMVIEADGGVRAVHEIVKIQDKPRSQALLSYHSVCLRESD